MGTRADLAAAIAPALPVNVTIIDHPRDIDRIDASVLAVVMLTRQGFETAPGGYVEEYELVVIEPHTDQGGDAEDALDDIAHQVADSLDNLLWLTWSKATRSTYDAIYPAYKFDIRLIANKE